MAALATIRLEVSVQTADGLAQDRAVESRFTPGAGSVGTIQSVTLTGSSFNALSPPSGAKALVIFSVSDASLVLKGVTGDTGINLSPSSLVPGLPAVIPLGSTPSIGILNSGGTVSVSLLWL